MDFSCKTYFGMASASPKMAGATEAILEKYLVKQLIHILH